MARRIFHEADFVWIFANISRAMSKEVAQRMLRRHFRKILMDKSAAFPNASELLEQAATRSLEVSLGAEFSIISNPMKIISPRPFRAQAHWSVTHGKSTLTPGVRVEVLDRSGS